MLNARNIKDIKTLEKSGNSLKDQDFFGNTLIHIITLKNNTDFIEDIFKSFSYDDSYFRIKNIQGKTPSFYIKSEKMFNLYLKYLGPYFLTDVNEKNENCITYISYT